VTQNILSIDVSTDMARAVVAEVHNRQIRILEAAQAPVGKLFELQKELPAEDLPAVDNLPGRDNAGAGGDGVLAETASDRIPSGHILPAAELLAEELENFRKLIHSFTVPWSQSILVIPSHDYLSLNLELPFNDAKNINKVLDLEVQDMVPFDLDEFLTGHHYLSSINGSLHDIHVSIISKAYLQNILRITRSVGLEPYIVSTPASALGALFYLSQELFSPNSAVIFSEKNCLHMIIQIGGQVRQDRLIRFANQVNSKNEANYLTDLKLTISRAEKRYEQELKDVYVLGNSIDKLALQKSLGKAVHSLNLSDIITDNVEEAGLAGLAAAFAEDNNPPPILTNFRTKEFSYRPQLRELYEGARKLLPFFLLTVILAIVCTVAVFHFRESRLTTVQAALNSQVNEALPGANIPKGEELSFLQTQNQLLEAELQDLGSPSRFSVLDALLELSKDMPESDEVTVTAINIRGNRVQIEGNIPSYAAADTIERRLRRNKAVYCRVRKDSSVSPGGRGGVGYKFDIWLCE